MCKTIDESKARPDVGCTGLLDQRLDDQIWFAERDLMETKGVCGNGTPACRLWHRLDELVKFIRSNDQAQLRTK